METKNIQQTKRLNVIGFLTIGLAVLITAGVSWLLYNHTVFLLTENLREKLQAIVATAAVEFDSNDIESLKIESDWEKPSWSRVVNQLRKIRENNDKIIFAYILRKNEKNPAKIEFVADSHSINPYANTDNDPTNNVDVDKNGTIDATDKLQWPGQEYEEPPKEAFLAYDGILANKDLYEDEYGVFMTGYAPIKNDQGEAIAVIAVDVRANEFFTITRQTLYPFLGFILLLILILTVLSSVIISIWNKRVYLFAELDRQKDELLSIVSHQLAAPVTSLKWYIELLQDGDLGVLQKEQQESISKMQSITVDLSDLVSMILDVSRIQLGKVKVTKDELDLSAFLQEILAVIEPRAKEKGINFVKAMPSSFPKIYIDKRLTRMTIENLLTNAIKYAPSGGHVEFRVEIRGNKLFASVKDTGCGIPKAEQSQMFSKLFRASNSRDKVEGNGFGLYVAKGAIESQGGKIWFESEVNKGTSFYIEMPYKKV